MQLTVRMESLEFTPFQIRTAAFGLLVNTGHRGMRSQSKAHLNSIQRMRFLAVENLCEQVSPDYQFRFSNEKL